MARRDRDVGRGEVRCHAVGAKVLGLGVHGARAWRLRLRASTTTKTGEGIKIRYDENSALCSSRTDLLVSETLRGLLTPLQYLKPPIEDMLVHRLHEQLDPLPHLRRRVSQCHDWVRMKKCSP